MINFNCDYLEGVHPNIIKAIETTNMIQQQGYGYDEYTIEAKELIKSKISGQDVYFIHGSTACNKLVIKVALRPHESVIACSNAHINTLETGAIEDTGHKIEIIEDKDGLLTPQAIEEFVKTRIEDSAPFHKPIPKMVYITNSSESGTIYTKKRLLAIREVCDKYGLYLFMDGARLPYAISASNNDLTLKEICEIVDVTYVGGTKCGAMFGEALIINNDDFKKNFKHYIKGSGMLLAKARFLGIQFKELFKDDLIFKLAKKADEQSDRIREKLREKNYILTSNSTTNTTFVDMEIERYERLKEKFNFCVNYRNEKYVNVRICTSWSTQDSMVDELIKNL